MQQDKFFLKAVTIQLGTKDDKIIRILNAQEFIDVRRSQDFGVELSNTICL